MFTTNGFCWSQAGEPESLSYQNVALPELAAGEVLVENQWVAFNPVDWKLIGWGPEVWSAGQIPGVDGMGIVKAVGAGVTHLRLGARVAYHADLRCHGSFAKHTIVAARALLPVPDALSGAAAAAFPCPGLTAWQAVAKLPALFGETVLVNGAASNVGRFVVQLLLERGARVFASASGRHHQELLRLGVQAVADYRDEEWCEQLRSANGGEPFSAIIDLVSAASAQALLSHLGYYGHLVAVLGRVEQNPDPAFNHCYSLHEIALGAQHQYGSDRQWQQLVAGGEQMLQQLANGALKMPPLKVGEFKDLPQLLGEFKRSGAGVKYVLKVEDLGPRS